MGHGQPEFMAKITGRTGTAYSFVEVQKAASGTWATLTDGKSGTLNAYEWNGSTSVETDTIVEMFPG